MRLADDSRHLAFQPGRPRATENTGSDARRAGRLYFSGHARRQALLDGAAVGRSADGEPPPAGRARRVVLQPIAARCPRSDKRCAALAGLLRGLCDDDAACLAA